MGAFAFYSNGVGYDTNVSTIAITMQNPEVFSLDSCMRIKSTNDKQIRDALSDHVTSMQPLKKNLGRLKLRFEGEKGFMRG